MSLRAALTRPRVAVLLALVLGAAGAVWRWGDDDAADRPDWSALPVAATPEIAPGPESLPERQVWALAQLDPCALATLQPVSSGSVALDTALRCTVRAFGPQVEVSIDFNRTTDLHSRVRTDIAGYAGWVGTTDEGCDVVLPVRQQASVTFAGDTADCKELLVARAEAVVRRWKRDPSAWVSADPLPQACQLAAAARVGGRLAARGLTCDLPGSRGVIVDVAPTLTFEDDARATVAGRQVIRSLEGSDRYGTDAGCSLRWERDGRLDHVTYWRRGVVVQSYDTAPLVMVTAPDCASAKRLAAQVIRADRAWQPPAPPRLMFYRFDEVDHTGTGACADVAEQGERQCAPSVEREVPGDPVAFLRQGEADPDVVCAAALSVTRELDVEVEAATVKGGVAGDEGLRTCVLVDPTHAFEVRVAASREPVGPGADAKVDGHRAEHPDDAGLVRWAIAHDQPEEPGSLHVTSRSFAAEGPAWLDDFVEELVRRVL